MNFPIVVYGCESWALKKAGCQRTDAFELWCWRKLESPLDSEETFSSPVTTAEFSKFANITVL